MRLIPIIEYTLKVNSMASNNVKNAEQKNKHKISYERSDSVSRLLLLKSTNMHTKWCTDDTVINSDSQTRFIAMVCLMQTGK